MTGGETGRMVAVTGAEGFVGQRLCARLAVDGDQVEAWDLPGVDLLDPDSIGAAVGRARPSVVFNLAASTLGGGTFSSSTNSANTLSSSSSPTGVSRETVSWEIL